MMTGAPAGLMLALETSSPRGEIALAREGKVVAERVLSAQRRHTAELMPAIADALQEIAAHAREISLCAYSCGPGSFTGLRVAATVARMLQAATGARVIAAPTLEVIARNALDYSDCPPAMAVLRDARRGQVYAALYRLTTDGLRCEQAVGVHDPRTWLASLPGPFCVIGEAVGLYADVCSECRGLMLPEAYWSPRAREVAALAAEFADAGRFCAPDEIVPLYVRPPECEEVYEQRRAAARARRGEQQ